MTGCLEMPRAGAHDKSSSAFAGRKTGEVARREAWEGWRGAQVLYLHSPANSRASNRRSPRALIGPRLQVLVSQVPMHGMLGTETIQAKKKKNKKKQRAGIVLSSVEKGYKRRKS
jgi:hypothetical protein